MTAPRRTSAPVGERTQLLEFAAGEALADVDATAHVRDRDAAEARVGVVPRRIDVGSAAGHDRDVAERAAGHETAVDPLDLGELQVAIAFRAGEGVSR